jgi:hypothetical protein
VDLPSPSSNSLVSVQNSPYFRLLRFPTYNGRMDTTTYTSDTSAEADDLQLECFRRMTPQQRFNRMSSWSAQIKRMAFDAIRRQHPDFSDRQVQLRFIELAYGTELAADFGRWLMRRANESSEGDGRDT